MINPETGVRSMTTIQLKLVEGADFNEVRDLLRSVFRRTSSLTTSKPGVTCRARYWPRSGWKRRS